MLLLELGDFTCDDARSGFRLHASTNVAITSRRTDRSPVSFPDLECINISCSGEVQIDIHLQWSDRRTHHLRHVAAHLGVLLEHSEVSLLNPTRKHQG